MILQFMENICQLIYSMPEITLVVLAFKSFNKLGLVAYTIVFTYPRQKKCNESKSGKHESQRNGPPLPIHLLGN